MRALTNEKEDDWDRFEDLEYSVYVVTGERDLNPRRARRADILVMTPRNSTRRPANTILDDMTSSPTSTSASSTRYTCWTRIGGDRCSR